MKMTITKMAATKMLNLSQALKKLITKTNSMANSIKEALP